MWRKIDTLSVGVCRVAFVQALLRLVWWNITLREPLWGIFNVLVLCVFWKSWIKYMFWERSQCVWGKCVQNKEEKC